MNTDAEQIEHLRDLERQAKRAGMWGTAACAAFVTCLIVAWGSGPVAGWPWMIGAMGAMAFLLWSLIDLRHAQQLRALHLLPHELSNQL